MKLLGLSIVVAMGLAIAWWWTREAPRVAKEAPPKQSARLAPLEPSNPTTPAPTRSTAPTLTTARWRPELVQPERVTLEPTATDPERRTAQESFLRYLRVFATEAELTDAQWDRFVRDLTELGAIEAQAWFESARDGDIGDAYRLNDELAHELEERIAAYLTERQLRVFRFRISAQGAITQVRQLHFVPRLVLAE